jgi:hypothetical protein
MAPAGLIGQIATVVVTDKGTNSLFGTLHPAPPDRGPMMRAAIGA